VRFGYWHLERLADVGWDGDPSGIEVLTDRHSQADRSNPFLRPYPLLERGELSLWHWRVLRHQPPSATSRLGDQVTIAGIGHQTGSGEGLERG
jgi:hypothetical protein